MQKDSILDSTRGCHDLISRSRKKNLRMVHNVEEKIFFGQKKKKSRELGDRRAMGGKRLRNRRFKFFWLTANTLRRYAAGGEIRVKHQMGKSC